MEMILVGFAALTIIVLFFGTAMASFIWKLVEEDSDKIIQATKPQNTEDIYRTKHQQISRQPSSPPSSPRSQPRAYVDRRHTAPTRTTRL